jgi:hypothetical protein
LSEISEPEVQQKLAVFRGESCLVDVHIRPELLDCGGSGDLVRFHSGVGSSNSQQQGQPQTQYAADARPKLELGPMSSFGGSTGGRPLSAQVAFSLALWVAAWLLIAQGLDVGAKGRIRPTVIAGGLFIWGIPLWLWL